MYKKRKVDLMNIDLMIFKDELKKLYPDGRVKKIRKLDYKLYEKIVEYCYKEKINIDDFMFSIGFRMEKERNELSYKKKLESSYLDKKVVELSRKHKTLYSNLFKFCQRENINIEIWMKENNFEYIKNKTRHVDVEKLEKKYLEMMKEKFPDKNITNFSKSHREMYNKIFYLCQKKGIKMKEWLLLNGFCDKEMNEEERIIEQLLLKYPNKKIVNLHKEDPFLYSKVSKIAYKYKMSVEQWMFEKGVECKRTDLRKETEIKKIQREFLREEGYVKELLEKYPNRKIINLSKNDNKLYAKIYKYCKTKNIEFSKWFEENGFEMISVRK